MTDIFKSSFTIVWVILALLTCVSWFLGDNYQAVETQYAKYFTTALMLLAFFKIRLVILHFMETKKAVMPLRLALEVWVVGVCALILFLYFFDAQIQLLFG